MFLELFLQAIKTCTGLLLPHNSWGWGVVSRTTSSLVPRPTWPGNDVKRLPWSAKFTVVSKSRPHPTCAPSSLQTPSLVIREPGVLTSSTYSDQTQTSTETSLSFKERNPITIFPLPWDKSRTVLHSDLLWLLHIGTNLSVFIYLSYFFNFHALCCIQFLVITQVYLICFVSSSSFFPLHFVCVPRTCT